MTVDRPARISLRVVALGYLALLLLVPVGVVLYRTFEHGIGAFWASITTPAAIHALWLTIEVALISVPLNAAFGVLAALALVRGVFPGKRVLDLALDLPFAVSPVVIGLSLVLVYGRTGWFGPWLTEHGIQVVPVLREVGDEQEQAAATLGASGWQTFWRVTLPSIRWGVAYGVVLSTARAIGEFGAVSVVSGKIAGETDTLTLLVEERFTNFDVSGAYAASALLALIALSTLLLMNLIGSRRSEP
jgi:sulfate transport system permease protein